MNNIPTTAKQIMPSVFKTATGLPTATYHKVATTLTCEEAVGKLPFNDINLKQTENFPNISIERNISYSKQTSSNGFTWQDVQYIADENCERADACTSDQSILTYDVFYPTDYPYTTCTTLPPCVILFKPGGFSDCNANAEATNLETVAKMLAKRGFVVFAPRYRTGRILSDKKVLLYGPYTNIPFTTAQQTLAFYRGFQDCRGAIRSILKRNSETGLSYAAKFDETKLFIGGFSAGALCAIFTAYYPNQPMIDEVAGGANVILGDIDEDFYYGEPSITYQSNIKGVLNCWGNGFIPEDDKDTPENFFPAASKIPLISFHGKQDKVVCPYNNQPVFYPPTTGGNSFSNIDPLHQNIKVNPVPVCPPPATPNFMLIFGDIPNLDADSWRYGSKKMFCFLRSINVYTEFYLDDEMGHGVQSVDDNFGTAYNTIETIYGYIAVRAATFFQAILHGQADPTFITGLKSVSNNKLFEECENFRVGFAPLNTPACTPEPSNFCTVND